MKNLGWLTFAAKRSKGMGVGAPIWVFVNDYKALIGSQHLQLVKKILSSTVNLKKQSVNNV